MTTTPCFPEPPSPEVLEIKTKLAMSVVSHSQHEKPEQIVQRLNLIWSWVTATPTPEQALKHAVHEALLTLGREGLA